jgi:hypothetical protein
MRQRTEDLNGNNEDNHGQREGVAKVNKVAALKRVREGDPREVAKGQHEAKAVHANVHRRQNGRLTMCVEGSSGERQLCADAAHLTLAQFCPPDR